MPAFYDVTYHDDGTIASFESNNVHAKPTIEKQMVLNVTDTYYPEKPVVPFYQSDSRQSCVGNSERMHPWMSFLSGGNAVSPNKGTCVRALKRVCIQMLKSTGHEEISLSSLSSSDYSQLKGL